MKQKTMKELPQNKLNFLEPSSKLIYSGRDAYGSAQVVDRDNLRSLHFGTNARQSEMNLTDPYELTLEYTRLMTLSLLFVPPPKSVLLLGLGGGSLPKFLWKHFPQCEIDVVERSPLVIELCYRYFGLPNSKRIAVHEADAFAFIKEQRAKYDLIFIDLYSGEGMSDIVAQQDFFKSCKERCADSGIVSWNVWKSSRPELMVDSVQSASIVFDKNVLILSNKVETNFIFLLLPKPFAQYDRFALLQHAQGLHKETGMPFADMFIDSILS